MSRLYNFNIISRRRRMKVRYRRTCDWVMLY
jgi:hypothetical protein